MTARKKAKPEGARWRASIEESRRATVEFVAKDWDNAWNLAHHVELPSDAMLKRMVSNNEITKIAGYALRMLPDAREGVGGRTVIVFDAAMTLFTQRQVEIMRTETKKLAVAVDQWNGVGCDTFSIAIEGTVAHAQRRVLPKLGRALCEMRIEDTQDPPKERRR